MYFLFFFVKKLLQILVKKSFISCSLPLEKNKQKFILIKRMCTCLRNVTEQISILVNIVSNFHSFKSVGRVTNAFITLLPPGLRSEGSYETRLTVSNFKRVCDPENSVNVTSKIKDTKLSLVSIYLFHCYFAYQQFIVWYTK